MLRMLHDMKPNRAEIQAEALSRATSGISLTNYPTIIEGFASMGIPIDDIRPRENVFTFQAWKALGRYVRKGEHGVKVLTYVSMTRKNEETGEPEQIGRHPRSTTVFHVSQTEALKGSV